MAGLGRLAVLYGLLCGVLAAPNLKNELKHLQEVLEKEAQSDESAHDKLGCWCQENQAAISKVVENARAKSGEMSNTIESLTARSAGLNIAIETHQKDISSTQSSLDKATSLRERESDDFKDDEVSHVSSIGSLEDALKALHAGHAADLTLSALKTSLQKTRGTKAHKLVSLMGKKLVFRGSQSPDQINGILKQMKGTFQDSLERIREDDATNQKRFEDIVSTKKEQLDAQQSGLTRKQQERAQVMQDLAFAKKRLTSADRSSEVDQALFVEVKNFCQAEDAGFTSRKTERQQEVVAISEAQSSLVDMPPSHLAALALSGNLKSPLNGDGAEKICAASRTIDRKWRSEAQSACADAKAGKASDAAKTTNSLREEVLAAQRKAEDSVSKCERSSEEGQTTADLHAAQHEQAKSSLGGTEAEIEEVNSQSAQNEKAKTELLAARQAQHAALQEMQFNALHASKVLDKAASLSKGTPAAAQLSDAKQHSDSLVAKAKDADAESDKGVAAVLDAQQKSMKALAKAMIPLKIAHAQAEEAVVTTRQEKESAATPTCDVTALSKEVEKLSATASQLQEASEELDFWA